MTTASPWRHVKAGDITFTPDGRGHGLANTGNTDLVVMALIIKDEIRLEMKELEFGKNSIS